MGRHVGTPSDGHQHGGRKPAKTSGVYLGYFKAFLLSAKLSHIDINASITCYASVNSSGASPPPPGQPRGICSRCQSRRRGIRNFIAARGLGICLPRGEPRAFDTRVFESAMEEFIGKDEAFVEDWLVVRQGLHKLVDVFLKGMFSQF